MYAIMTDKERKSMADDVIVVWIVEDNVIYRQSTSQLLSRTEGFTCGREFSRCEDAIAAIRQGEAPSVILLDISLPGMSGIDAIPIISGLTPSTKILILSVHEEYEKVFDAICAGASGYLLKNTKPDQLITAITDVLAGGAPMNAQIARRVLDLFARKSPRPAEYGLTERESEVLGHLVSGRSKRQIADTLFVSYHTVDTHLKNIYHKLQVHSRTGAVAKALKERLL
jgi:DNA-binding NarL/FixJ family response regulator